MTKDEIGSNPIIVTGAIETCHQAHTLFHGCLCHGSVLYTTHKHTHSIQHICLVFAFSVDVILDPCTAHPELVLSDDMKQVSFGHKRHRFADTPERFDSAVSVLAKEGYCSGRFYYEVLVKGKTDWDLGVASESINRKGEIKLSPEHGYFTIVLRNGDGYMAAAGPTVSLSLSQSPEKIGVFVDYNESTVSFYNVDALSQIYSFTGLSFTEKLYPYFNPFLSDGERNNAPLIITPVSQSTGL